MITLKELSNETNLKVSQINGLLNDPLFADVSATYVKKDGKLVATGVESKLKFINVLKSEAFKKAWGIADTTELYKAISDEKLTDLGFDAFRKKMSDLAKSSKNKVDFVDVTEKTNAKNRSRLYFVDSVTKYFKENAKTTEEVVEAKEETTKEETSTSNVEKLLAAQATAIETLTKQVADLTQRLSTKTDSTVFSLDGKVSKTDLCNIIRNLKNKKERNLVDPSHIHDNEFIESMNSNLDKYGPEYISISEAQAKLLVKLENKY